MPTLTVSQHHASSNVRIAADDSLGLYSRASSPVDRLYVHIHPSARSLARSLVVAWTQLLLSPPLASRSSFILATRFLNSTYWHFSYECLSSCARRISTTSTHADSVAYLEDLGTGSVRFARRGRRETGDWRKGKRTPHFHGAYHVSLRHLLSGMRRWAQLSL